MAPRDPRPPHDELVTHAGFLRALARGMLADEHLAEDVVQQAFLSALARPPAERGFLGAWLARVVRNLALNARRGEERRSVRERMAARDEVDAAHERATLELLLQREVAAALAELGEPYRAVVHLRYFRALSIARIAQELALTPKVVETRLARAHELLRRRLARAWDEQDERARAVWLALAPAGKGIGGLLMAKTIAWVGVGGALVAGLVWTWRALGGDGARADAPRVVEQPLAPPPALSPGVGESERESAVVEPVPTLTEPSSVPVVDLDAELRASLDELGFILDRSLDGRLDPGAILDAAFLVLERELGAPELEPDYAGRVVIPFEGMPEGVTASLCINKLTSSQKKVLTLEIQLPREVPLVNGNFERSGPRVTLSTWTSEGGELENFSILTDINMERRVGTLHQDPSEMQHGLSLHTPLADPSSWTLKASGLREVEGSRAPDGSRKMTGASWEVPQALDGRPWPPVDDLRRFNSRLHELHAAAKERAGR